LSTICPRPTIQVFSPNVLPQAAQNTAVELVVHGLAQGDKFMVHNPSGVENPDEHILFDLRLCLAFFDLENPGFFHCEDCLLSFGFIPVDPILVPSNNAPHVGLVIEGTMTNF
jgi:hypothetical protein